MSAPRSRFQRMTASLRARFHVEMASCGSAGSSMPRRPSATRTSLAWTIPSMPSLIARKYSISASMNAPGSNGAPGRSEYRMPGMSSWGCVTTT